MKALITGITGQDGSYLAELLVEKGYEVYGLVRRLSRPNLGNIQSILEDVTLLDGDLLDQSSLNEAVKKAQPDEVYNLASQSFVGTSFIQPVLTGEVTGLGAVRMLEAVRYEAPDAKFFQASSSEMFGWGSTAPLHEFSRFQPRSPYGVAKLYAYWLSVNYRQSYDMFVSNGIFFNHESPRRGMEFVTRKIAYHAARHETVKLGNLEAQRDWGYAPEYVELMWRILQHPKPEDFIGATGESHSVGEFFREAYDVAGVDEPDSFLVIDQGLTRPSEVLHLRGYTDKAERFLGWRATVKFKNLVRIMVEAEMAQL